MRSTASERRQCANELCRQLVKAGELRARTGGTSAQTCRVYPSTLLKLRSSGLFD
jgi:hypothetical protein